MAIIKFEEAMVDIVDSYIGGLPENQYFDILEDDDIIQVFNLMLKLSHQEENAKKWIIDYIYKYYLSDNDSETE